VATGTGVVDALTVAPDDSEGEGPEPPPVGPVVADGAPLAVPPGVGVDTTPLQPTMPTTAARSASRAAARVTPATSAPSMSARGER
jgi:hypothetical protein